jgi:hypothetical protein
LQPQPVPPISQPEPFADGVLRYGEHPVRKLPLGWGAQKLLWGQKLSPRDSPDNLFQPLPGDPGPHGRFDDRSRSTTAWAWLRLHRGRAGAALALGTMGLLASRSGRFFPMDWMSQSWRFWS